MGRYREKEEIEGRYEGLALTLTLALALTLATCSAV